MQLIIALAIICTLAAASSTPSKGGFECPLCEYIVGYVEEFVSQNKTEHEIMEIFEDDFCDKFLPKAYQGQCEAMVEAYLPDIIAYVVENESADKACADLGICTADGVAPPAVGGSALECTICQYLMGWVEQKLAQNATLAEIETFLENDVCALLPKAYSSTCDALVTAYLPQIIAALENKEDPQTICGSLKLCSSDSLLGFALTMLRQMTHEQPEAANGGIECAVCTYVVGWAEQLLAENKSEAEIQDFLENKVCTLLPKSRVSTCQALVAAYLKEIIQGIINKQTPDEICATIHMCGSSTDSVADIAIDNLIADVDSQ